jgi:hypothetical protein
MPKDRPQGGDRPKPVLSQALDKILNEDRVGLAQEQRKKLRLMKVYFSIEFDQKREKQ